MDNAAYSSLLSRTAPDRLAAGATRALALVADGSVRIDLTARVRVRRGGNRDRLAEGATRGKSIVTTWTVRHRAGTATPGSGP